MVGVSLGRVKITDDKHFSGIRIATPSKKIQDFQYVADLRELNLDTPGFFQLVYSLDRRKITALCPLILWRFLAFDVFICLPSLLATRPHIC